MELGYIHMVFYKQIINVKFNFNVSTSSKKMRDDHICLFHSKEELVSHFYLHENPESKKDLYHGH